MRGEECELFVFLANANAEIDNLQQELIKKSDDQNKEQEEILRLSYDVTKTPVKLQQKLILNTHLDARNSSSIR